MVFRPYLSTKTLLVGLALTLASGCSFRNPAWDGSHSESTTAATTAGSGTTVAETTAGVTTQEPSTGNDDSSLTDVTVSTTVDPSNSESDTETGVEPTTETEPDQCNPGVDDPPSLDLLYAGTNIPVVFPDMGTFELWIEPAFKDDFLQLANCPPGCNGCDLDASYEVHVKVPDDLGIDAPSLLELGPCLHIQFDIRRPSDFEEYEASAMVIRDGDDTPRYVIVDGQFGAPSTLEVGSSVVPLECDICDQMECCQLPPSDHHGIRLTGEAIDPEPLLEPEEMEDVLFYGYPGIFKNYRATIEPDCTADFQWILSTLD